MSGMPTGTLAGRRALVTGAARGFGAAIAARLRAAGATVWASDRDLPALEATAAAIGARALALDVRERSDFVAAAARIGAEGPLHILVNNAGLLTAGPFDATTTQQWDEMLSVNAGALFHSAQVLVPLMPRGACIVNVASVSAARGGGAIGNLWYGATKAAVVAITSGLARELGPRGIRVNAVAPGLADTALTHDLLTPDVLARLQPRFPLGRLASADDVAAAVLTLCSDDTGFITGATLPVDGGFLCT